MSDLQALFSYLACFPDLMRATSDDTSPTPGYMLHKISDLTLSSPGQTPKLVEFLVMRLQTASSPTSKLKTLRLMLYCARHGSPEFRRLLRSRDGDVTMASAASGPADPVLGMTPHLWVHSTSQELLSVLFAADDDVTERAPRSPMVGLGPAAVSPGVGGGGQYQGFGVSSVKRTGGVSLPSRLRDLVEGALSPPCPGPPPPDALATSTGQYQPPTVLAAAAAGAVPGLPGPPLRVTSAPQQATRGHIPGRAGGGWEDSDEEPTDVDDVSVGSDVAAAMSDADETSSRPPSSEEARAVAQYCRQQRGPPRSLVEPVQLADRLTASGSSSRDVTTALVDQLTQPGDVRRLRALVLLDCLLQAGGAAAGDGGAALAEAVVGLTSSSDERVKTKAVKVGRIMERLGA